MPRDRPWLAVLAVLAAPRAEQQQHRERAGGPDQVDRGRAGEVLHAEVGLQPAAAEHPVRGDRVDEPGEDDRVDDVDAELDPLERRAPHDRQRDGAEDELEEPLRLDRRVGEPHDGERLLRVAVVAQEEAVVADDVADAEREGEADRPVHERRDREVREDLRDHGACVLPAGEPDLEERKTGLHEHHETAGDDHPQRVDRHGVGEDAVIGRVQGVGGRNRRYCQGSQEPQQGSAGRATNVARHNLLGRKGARRSVGRTRPMIIGPVSKNPRRRFSHRSIRPQTPAFRRTLGEARRGKFGHLYKGSRGQRV